MIDTSKIENFETMTDAEKVEALLKVDTDEKRYKDLISKANSEAKKYKDMAKAAEDKLKEQMSEDELKRAEEVQRIQAIEEENKRLKRESQVARKSAFYTSLGFDAELAKATAEAFADGDFGTVEANTIKAHQEFEKNIRADVARSNPHPQNLGGGKKEVTKEQFNKMTYKERLALFETDRDAYDALNK